jgi:3-hydroxyacyl-CoA dehydrogenase
MTDRIRKVAVLGAGTMGAQIAAHAANAGLDALLLDIVPREPTDEEARAGLTLSDRRVRDMIAAAGLDAARKARPAAFFLPEYAARIQIGNLDDDLAKIADADLVVEAIVENLDVKRALFERVESHLKPGAIVATNTSGIPIRTIAEGRSDAFRKSFLGMHFFNPPRYMKLVELIATPETDPDVLERAARFLDERLGKGVVYAKDAPNFIANRIGTFGALVTINAAIEDGFTLEEVDALTGTPIGHPKMATFRLMDLVGVDVFAHVARNLYDNAPHDERRDAFSVPPVIAGMVERKLLGNKTRGGFYKKQGDEILTLDPATLEYRAKERPKLPSLDTVKTIDDVRERVRMLVLGKDRAGQFLWKTTVEMLAYAANRIPEIADDVLQVDRAVRWGFNWELGPFELWDALGVRRTVERMRTEGRAVPEKVERMLDAGAESFYKREDGRSSYWDFEQQAYVAVDDRPGVLVIRDLKERKRVVKKAAGASLVDLGDGVLCVEFHSKMNAIGGDTIGMLNAGAKALEDGEFDALVVANEGENFSVGANLMLLLLEAQEQNWEDVDLMIRAFQGANMRLKTAPRPVVVAPFGMALGGGCEMTLHASRVRAAAETYIGLVELGVGLVPAGGGTKEMLLRAVDAVGTSDADLFAFLRKAFETIAMAKVATSAEEARKFGFLRQSDSITMNRDRLVADAKQVALDLVAEGYTPYRPRTDVPALGEPALAAFKLGIYQMRQGGFISEHDAKIATKLARILTGGDLSHRTTVTEQYLLDLEREAFLSLCGERKTLERIQAMLKTGKPLRN